MTNILCNANDFGKVAVLTGGTSAEREISLQSGEMILEALLSKGIDAFAIDMNDNFISQLQESTFDRAFIASHGGFAENGILQAVLSGMQIPFTGPSQETSAICMDKALSKLIWMGSSVLTAPFLSLEKKNDQEILKILGLPLVIKPACDGSSLGITIVREPSQMKAARLLAYEYGDRAIAEKFIQGRELSIPIVGSRVLPIVEIKTKREFYNYEAKYLDDDTQLLVPATLSETEANAVRNMAKAAFAAVNGKSLGRIDFILDDQGRPWVLEINTMPGMTSHSLVPAAALAEEISFQDLVVLILQETLEKKTKTI